MRLTYLVMLSSCSPVERPPPLVIIAGYWLAVPFAPFPGYIATASDDTVAPGYHVV